MGACNSNDQKQAEAKSESPDPPVAVPVVEDAAPVVAREEPQPHPAPITVDLHSPPVDLSAPLDERDIDLVQQTFGRVAMLGVENVGWVLFMNIFEIAPQAKGLFPFKDEQNLAKSSRMKAHAGRVVSTVATAVSLLRDLPTLVPVLHSLGLKHVGYGVVPEHYDVVGQALIKSLGTALGDKMTPAVTNAYLKVFTIVKATMIEKCDYSSLAQASEESQADAAKTANGEDDSKSSPDKGKKPVKKQADNQVAKKKAEAAKDATKKKKPEEVAAPTPSPEEAKPAVEEAPTISADQKLLAAAKSGDAKLIREAVKEGAFVSITDESDDYKTSLHLAVEKGHDEAVGALLKAKIKVDAVTRSSKETALHIACRENFRDIAVMLILQGKANISARNKAGKVPAVLAQDPALSSWLQSGKSGAGGGAKPSWQNK